MSCCSSAPAWLPLPADPRTPSRGSRAFPAAEARGALHVLLLNSETKDEGEELLDYFFPGDDPKLLSILPMKGVLVACCGVTRAAVGQEVAFFLFWSEDGSEQHKACFCRVDGWILCLVLPGSVCDGVARFFVQEAAGLIALRHGRLQSLKGSFRQLDPIFRSLTGMWERTWQLQCDPEAETPRGMFYVCLGALLRHPLVDGWREVVQDRLAKWEQEWTSAAQDGPLVPVEGFAVFFSQAFVATSLSDPAFEACLRICLMEGALEPDAAVAAADAGEVRGRSIFLRRDSDEDLALPSHQYSVLRRGPWLLFVLWQMGPRTCAAEDAASPASSSGDLGIELCLGLLGSLPLPEGHAKKHDPSPRQRGKTTRHIQRQLSCSKVANVFRSGSIRKDGSRDFGSESPATRRDLPQRRTSSCAVEISPAPPAAAEEMAEADAAEGRTAATALREPARCGWPWAAGGAGGAVACPEMRGRVASLACPERGPQGVPGLLSTWCELERLVHEHGARRAAWQRAPGLHLSRHVLVNVLRGDRSLSRVWRRCAEESGLAGGAALGGAAAKAVVKLGDGEPWRFQAGAPYLLSDLAPIVSVGALTDAGGALAWGALSCRGGGQAASCARRSLLWVDALGEGEASP